MRALLELKAAATMEPQSDIRDRTPGRLALSGMYGFGQAFTSTDALAFDGQADFAEWLKEVTPGVMRSVLRILPRCCWAPRNLTASLM